MKKLVTLIGSLALVAIALPEKKRKDIFYGLIERTMCRQFGHYTKLKQVEFGFIVYCDRCKLVEATANYIPIEDLMAGMSEWPQPTGLLN